MRDFDGERLIQSLGEERVFEVCAACVSEEMRASLFPVKRILRKCSGFALLVLAGVALTMSLSVRDVMSALRVLGPLAVLVGASGIAGKVREILRTKRLLQGMSESGRRKFCAWQCVIRSAPAKYQDNDITYIPADDADALSPEELSVKYNLLPPISRKAYEVIHKEQ